MVSKTLVSMGSGNDLGSRVDWLSGDDRQDGG
jgi:hypothetical protein